MNSNFFVRGEFNFSYCQKRVFTVYTTGTPYDHDFAPRSTLAAYDQTNCGQDKWQTDLEVVVVSGREGGGLAVCATKRNLVFVTWELTSQRSSW
jgi:hypothetical protein